MTLIVCLFILFLNTGTVLNLLQQRNVAVVDGLVVCQASLNSILMLHHHTYVFT